MKLGAVHFALIGASLLGIHQSESEPLTLSWSPRGITGFGSLGRPSYPSAIFRLRNRGVPIFTNLRRYIEDLQKRAYGRVLRPNSYSFYRPPYPAFGNQDPTPLNYPGLVFPFTPRRPSSSFPMVRYCDEIRENNPAAADGEFAVNVDGLSMMVYCDFDYMGHNWVVFQRRNDANPDFYKPWADYENGFGTLTANFWLGLSKLHALTRRGSYTLRVELQNYASETAFAEYNLFKIGSPGFKYRLRVGAYSGDAGDALSYHRDFPFTTSDMDNDFHYQGLNCAIESRGAWWYNSCHLANLNGNYFPTAMVSMTGMTWFPWKNSFESLMTCSMRFRSN